MQQHACVQLAPGTYTIPDYVNIPVGHDIQGLGLAKTDVVIQPGAGFPTTGGASTLLWRGVPGTDASAGQISTITNLTLDGRRPDGQMLSHLAGSTHLEIEKVVMRYTQCYGLAIQGYSTSVRNSVFENNGLSCASAPPGAGIYTTPLAGDPAVAWAPVIEDNEFHSNNGPAVDAAGVRNGVFRRNFVHDNKGYAGFALFGSKGWMVEDNTIYHPATEPGYPYTAGNCHSGAYGRNKPAAIFLCQKSDVDNKVTTTNTVRNNRASSYWGILLVGNDETQPYWAPRANTISGNTLTGSNVGCADDFAPGQWYSDDNVWTGNSCGTPTYF